MNVNRIRADHHVTAVVALDSFDLIAARVERLVPQGRRLTAAHRYATYTGASPELYPGLTVAAVRINYDTTSLWVECDLNGEPEFGFGIGIRSRYNAETEGRAWENFHARQHEAEAYSERRRDLTWIQLTGGREGDELSRGDLIVIRTYNGDGVCDERVVAFDNGGDQ